MALTFPRAFPLTGFTSVKFGLERTADLGVAQASGRDVSVQVGAPRWVGEWTTPVLSRADFEEWTAWLQSLQGKSRLFYGRDPRRNLPRSHPQGLSSYTRAGGGSFAGGDATSCSVNTARDVLTLNGFPAGFLLKTGDHIGFSWSTSKRFLVRAMEDATANGSGVVVVTIDPALPSWLTSATAKIIGADCTMTLQSVQSDEGNMGRTGRITFSGRQHIEA
jgi:hypothetical protein